MPRSSYERISAYEVELSYLHGDLAVIDEDLAGQEIRPDGSLVAGAELLVDLYSGNRSSAIMGYRCRAWKPGWVRTYWFIRLVLPTPLSPRIMTYRNQVCELNHPGQEALKHMFVRHIRTFRRTFFREAMAGAGYCYQ
jgi:hypothetical protein